LGAANKRQEWLDLLNTAIEIVAKNNKLAIYLAKEFDCSAYGKINCMKQLGDYMLVGFMSSVIQVWNVKSLTYFKALSLRTPKLDEGSCCVMAMTEHAGSLWIAMTNLLVEVDRVTLEPKWQTHLDLPRTIVCVVSAGSFLWVDTDRALSVWNTKEKHNLFQISNEEKIFTMVSVKDCVLISGWNASMQVWDANVPKLLCKMPSKQEFGVRCMVVSSEDPAITVWTGSYDKSVALWN